MRCLYLTDSAFSRRLERAEGRAASRFVEVRARFEPDAGAAWMETAGAYLLYDGADSPMTQTFALGLSGLPSGTEIEGIEEYFEARNAPVLHEVSPLADPGMLGLLSGRGYKPVELTSLLVQPLAGRAIRPVPVEVREAAAEERELWAQTAAGGWRDTIPVTDAMVGLMRVMGAAEGVRGYFACIDGVPVATGALAIHDGVALLAGAATLPEWRGRGAQRALLEYRLAAAAEAGCDLAMMGAAPGSASQRNAERQGFRIAYTRIKWGR
jgi:GNAT superfamily N-acetyltransferase